MISAASIGATAQAGDAAGATACPVDQHAALEKIFVDQRVPDCTNQHDATERECSAQHQRAATDLQLRKEIEDDGDEERAGQHAGRNAGQQPREPRTLPRVVQAHRSHADEHDHGKQRAARKQRPEQPAHLVRLRVEAERHTGVRREEEDRCFDHCQHGQVQVPVMLEYSYRHFDSDPRSRPSHSASAH